MGMAVSENGLTVLNFLKENAGANLTAADIAKALGMDPVAGPKKINGIVTAGLIGTREPKKNYAVREEAQIKITDDEGNEKYKDVKFIKITEAGMAYDHETALAEDAAAKAAAKDAE